MMSTQVGGTLKADAVRKLSKGGCVKMQTRGKGVKKYEHFADVICTWSLRSSISIHAELINTKARYML